MSFLSIIFGQRRATNLVSIEIAMGKEFSQGSNYCNLTEEKTTRERKEEEEKQLSITKRLNGEQFKSNRRQRVVWEDSLNLLSRWGTYQQREGMRGSSGEC